jgi:hypothetical protein
MSVAGQPVTAQEYPDIWANEGVKWDTLVAAVTAQSHTFPAPEVCDSNGCYVNLVVKDRKTGEVRSFEALYNTGKEPLHVLCNYNTSEGWAKCRMWEDGNVFVKVRNSDNTWGFLKGDFK